MPASFKTSKINATLMSKVQVCSMAVLESGSELLLGSTMMSPLPNSLYLPRENYERLLITGIPQG